MTNSGTLPRSKFEYGTPSLFLPEPPNELKRATALFRGRERERARCVETLKSCVDVNGKYQKKNDKKPWIIHGESRVGKSHLARCVISDMPKGKRIKIIVSAKERGSSYIVLEQIFQKLKHKFDILLGKKRHETKGEISDELEVTSKILNLADSFITKDEERETFIEIGTDVEANFGLDTSLKILTSTILKFGFKESKKTGMTIKMKAPTATDYAFYCMLISEVLVFNKMCPHVLILIDDVDLIKGYKDQNTNGRVERSELSELIIGLHSARGVDVLVTSRSWFAFGHKDYKKLVELDEMDSRMLIEIHDARILHYTPKYPESFLTKEALQDLADNVSGLPGVFLHKLEVAFDAFQNEDGWEQRDFTWIMGVFQKKYAAYKTKSLRAAQRLESSIKSGEISIDVTGDNPFLSTPFEDIFVTQSYYSESTYNVDALTIKVVEANEEGS